MHFVASSERVVRRARRETEARETPKVPQRDTARGPEAKT